MKTGSTSATNARSSTSSSSGSSRAPGGSSRGAGAGRKPERAAPGKGAATASKQTRKPSGSRLTGAGSRLGDAWRKRLTRWGERLSRPWDGGGPQPEGTPKERRRRPSGGSDSTQSAEQVTLTYYCLLVSTLVLETFGLIMVFSVQSVTVAANGGNAFTDIALQCLVFTPVGVNVYGNRNWIQVPGVGTAQPSEFIKVALALVLGTLVTWYANKRPRDRAWVAGWGGVGVAIASVLGGQDLGTVIILVIIVAGALWVGGMRKRWFALLGAGGSVMFAAASMLSANRRARITAWIHPEGADPMGVGYQPKHGMWALGTGGWLGVGPGSSRQKWGYLTQADSDYIFAVLGEEFGLVGTLVVIALFAVIGACCLRLMRRHTSLYVVATTSAIGAWIVGQAIINMGVVTGALPVLGVPLPLVSRGGTALVSVLLAIGVLLAFARHEPGAQEALSTSPGALRRSLAVIVPRRNRARDK